MAHFYTPVDVPCDVCFFAAPEPPTREVDSLKEKTEGETITYCRTSCSSFLACNFTLFFISHRFSNRLSPQPCTPCNDVRCSDPPVLPVRVIRSRRRSHDSHGPWQSPPVSSDVLFSFSFISHLSIQNS